MTRKELYEKYGDVLIKFSGYYKYSFTFKADLPDGNKLTCSVGGDADEIYRLEVSPERHETVTQLEPNWVVVKDGENLVDSFKEF